MDEYTTFAKTYSPQIAKRMQEIFELLKERESTHKPHVADLLDDLEEFALRGGKMVRALLVLLGVLSQGEKIDDKAITLAASYELIQVFFLAHDDIMDQADKRREKPSLHKSYEKFVTEDKERFGRDVAIIGGDIYSLLGFKLLAMTDVKAEVIHAFTNMLLDTCFGQLNEYRLGFVDTVEESDVYEIYRFKTSMYTIRGPLDLGARYGGAKQEFLDQLESFADPLGILYQIKDDVLDFNGENTGKPLYGDLREGKSTLPIIKALEFLKEDKESYERVKNALGAQLTQEEGKEIAQLFAKCGAINYCEEKINELTEEARIAADKVDIDERAKNIFSSFVEYLVSRKV